MPTKQIYCCICSNHANKIVDGEKISLHRFTSDPKKRSIWIKRCNLVRKDFKFTSYGATRICGKHFVGGKGPTKEHNIPSVFPTKTFQISHYSGEISNKELEIPDTEIIESVLQDGCTSPSDDEHSISDSDHLPSCSSTLDTSITMHDYCSFTSEVSSKRNQSSQTPILATYECKETQTDANMWFNETGSQTNYSVFTGMVEQGTQVEKPTLTFEDIKDDDDKVLFYTGIPNSHTFQALFDEIKFDAVDQTGRKQTLCERNKSESGVDLHEDGNNNIYMNDVGRPRILRLIDEFLLVLMRLRLGLLLQDLADRFHISVTTCGTIFNKWIDYLDVQLEFLVKWPSKDINRETMPSSFRAKYPNCRVIIDCTEIRTETPTSLQLKSALYSDYKSHMTFKSLVGINPAGVVTFVSDLYAGSVSDKQITKLSGIIDLCEEGDAIMADKGFIISDLTTPKGIELIIPPFKSKKKQFSKREVTQTKDIANLRIHVEREMERIKNFRILQGVMPISMASQSTKIWKLCTRLTNLQPPLVPQ